ncbi:GAF domain-containing protein [Salinibacterium sp. PAMC 21357]|uniref:GAF domain-containing protein n=1 Tax=Salinibacterium sp. PAMC 21357 TaxID=1112215 RepID=UPI0005850B94|nr:GAF domain-containing protein [Salinibacterium sp. PAMC 21357]
MAWPFVKLGLAVIPQSWRTLVVPTDEPHAEAVGPDPDRVLVLGPGKSMGFGVNSHELGLGGHLARQLAVLTKRGCSVDIVSDPSMSLADTRVAVSWAHLERFDALVLTLGGTDILRIRSHFVWRRDVTALLDAVQESGGGALPTSVLGIAPADDVLSLPSFLLRIVNMNIAKLNTITEEQCNARAGVTFVPATAPSDDQRVPFESRTYEHWARELAPAIAVKLAHVAVPPATSELVNENQRVFDGSALATKEVSATLTAIMNSARVMFGTSGAAVTFHDQEAHWFTSTSGVGDMRREEAGAFCSSAFTTRGLVVLEDTMNDPRFADHPWVVRGPRIRFYAGYPISAANGHIIGAVCVFDTGPRTFDSSHESLLRELALRTESAIQRH